MFWDRTRPGIRIIYRSYNIRNVQYRRIKATKCSRKRQITTYSRHKTARKRCQYNSPLFGGKGIKRRRFPFRWNTLRNLEWRIAALKTAKNGPRFHRLRPELSRFRPYKAPFRRSKWSTWVIDRYLKEDNPTIYVVQNVTNFDKSNVTVGVLS